MKNKISFIIRFLVLTIVLYIIWIPLGKGYLLILAWISQYLLWVIGYHVELVVNGMPYFIYNDMIIDMENTHLSNFTLVPLVALIFATPGIKFDKRLNMLIIGVFILFCIHITGFVSHFPIYIHGSKVAETVMVFIAVCNMAVPFVLWFILAHKEILGIDEK